MGCVSMRSYRRVPKTGHMADLCVLSHRFEQLRVQLYSSIAHEAVRSMSLDADPHNFAMYPTPKMVDFGMLAFTRLEINVRAGHGATHPCTTGIQVCT